jgi:hypothetical protein
MRIGRDRIANELLKLGMPPEKETLAERLDDVVMKLMSGQMVNDARQFTISCFRRQRLKKINCTMTRSGV